MQETEVLQGFMLISSQREMMQLPNTRQADVVDFVTYTIWPIVIF